jgi:hypothetical protein
VALGLADGDHATPGAVVCRYNAKGPRGALQRQPPAMLQGPDNSYTITSRTKSLWLPPHFVHRVIDGTTFLVQCMTRSSLLGENLHLFFKFLLFSAAFTRKHGSGKKQEEYLTAHIYIYMILLTLWESHFTAFCFWYLNAT